MSALCPGAPGLPLLQTNSLNSTWQSIKLTLLVSPATYLDGLNLADDPDNLAFLVGKGWAGMQKARKLSEVDVSHYDAIFVPGGLAPMVDMPDHPLLKEVIKQ